MTLRKRYEKESGKAAMMEIRQDRWHSVVTNVTSPGYLKWLESSVSRLQTENDRLNVENKKLQAKINEYLSR